MTSEASAPGGSGAMTDKPAGCDETGSRQSVIARFPTDDGNEWECQCAHCGSSMTHEHCWACGGDGYTAPGELYEEDPLWYGEDDTEPCHQCGGTGGWLRCLSSFGEDDQGDASWCELHPLPGRERAWGPEWFLRDSAPSHPAAETLVGEDRTAPGHTKPDSSEPVSVAAPISREGGDEG